MQQRAARKGDREQEKERAKRGDCSERMQKASLNISV